jgi:hypothetical protein
MWGISDCRGTLPLNAINKAVNFLPNRNWLCHSNNISENAGKATNLKKPYPA